MRWALGIVSLVLSVSSVIAAPGNLTATPTTLGEPVIRHGTDHPLGLTTAAPKHDPPTQQEIAARAGGAALTIHIHYNVSVLPLCTTESAATLWLSRSCELTLAPCCSLPHHWAGSKATAVTRFQANIGDFIGRRRWTAYRMASQPGLSRRD